MVSGYLASKLNSSIVSIKRIRKLIPKFEYLKLPMGLCNSPDIFQEKMNELFHDFEFVRAYIDDLLIITKGTYEHHIDAVEKVLARLEKVGLKINATKSAIAQTQLEYLGYWITRDGIQPIPNKVEAIHI